MSNQQTKHTHAWSPQLKQSNALLRQQGYRLTPQRYLILSLLESAHDHLSIEELLSQAKNHYPSMNLSTIYRTLDLLKEIGLVRETRFPDENPRYEIQTQTTHHHLICRQCRQISHLEDPCHDVLRNSLEKRYGFHQVQMEVMSVGYCDPCWQSLRIEDQQEEERK